jgi:spore maturation protein CgeB
MKIVIFGLTVSSSWGNGHATLWRGLLKALGRRGHSAVFYERDVPYYASTRDLWELPYGRLRLYAEFAEIAEEAAGDLFAADLAIVTSYCPDAARATQLLQNSQAKLKAFYDLDTPVTLDRLRAGEPVSYLPLDGLSSFDLVLSYTVGRALEELEEKLGARRVFPLYGSVDPDAHCRVEARKEFRADLSYLGTYAPDRQEALERFVVEPARHLPKRRFLIGGAQYPTEFPWSSNIWFVRHTPPALHPAFFSSCRATLNITRRAMAEYGSCPSGRLFEAAACGAPILTDGWEGLECFFEPDRELLVVQEPADVIEALERSDEELRMMAKRARERTLDEHTADHRIRTLEDICGRACEATMTAAPA